MKIKKTFLSVVLALAAGCATTSQRGALNLAQNYYQRGEPEKALAALERARNYDVLSEVDHAGAMLLEALCYEQLRRLPEAAELYQRILATWPGTAFADKANAQLKHFAR